ncbi:uncharacterized protein LOC143035926 [Oratosquilla oratoria]|uniref:uncharacterized protein LOC143035926 n=1 Tax=Oratosquilla oratoria TaxID=337810 RepID=UPI003F776C40
MKSWTIVVILGLLLYYPVEGKHRCDRKCLQGDTQICYYDFHVEEYLTLSRACYYCPSNVTDCSRPHCVAADGVTRPIMTVNRQIPGPAIEVCHGDRVVVNVHHEMLSESLAIHWHGLQMRGTPYMDGVAMVTQCPITSSFVYDFVASEVGTHFWHSHSGYQRADGLYGAIVIRTAEDPHALEYNFDQDVLVVADWPHVRTSSRLLKEHRGSAGAYEATFLVNGKGRNMVAGEESVPTPFEVVQVDPWKKHRLRIINANTCSFLFSIDGHRFSAINSDGADLKPVQGDSIMIHSGERWDLVVEANQPIGNYWIRISGFLSCSRTKCHQGAILRYAGAPTELPKEELSHLSTPPPGIYLNPLNSNGETDDEVTLVEMQSLKEASYKTDQSLKDDVDFKFYLSFDVNGVANTAFFDEQYYAYSKIPSEFRIFTPQIDHITLRLPSSPLLTQPRQARDTLCQYGGQPPKCTGDFCSCTYYLKVDLNATVELVLVDEGSKFDGNHPLHLHGYNFYVVGMERLGKSTSVSTVQKLDIAGLLPRNLRNPVSKDSVTIPDGGYTIVRFTADNPGWWFMHCHLLTHSEKGMGLFLRVGNQRHLPPPPLGFPTCGPFSPPLF